VVWLACLDIYKIQTRMYIYVYHIYMLDACVGHYVTFKGDKKRPRPKSNHKIRVKIAVSPWPLSDYNCPFK